VKTDNSAATSDSSPTAIAPLGGDFNMSGGLYRGVSLIETPAKVHLALDDLGSTGVFARNINASTSTATVNVLAKVRNSTTQDGTYTVVASLLESDGQTVKKSVSTTAVVKAGSMSPVAQDLVVDSPHLWAGLSDPYLYNLVVAVKDANGNTLDKVAFSVSAFAT
jgi:beta-galactosidase